MNVMIASLAHITGLLTTFLLQQAKIRLTWTILKNSDHTGIEWYDSYITDIKLLFLVNKSVLLKFKLFRGDIMNVMIACFTHMKSRFLTTFLFLSGSFFINWEAGEDGGFCDRGGLEI